MVGLPWRPQPRRTRNSENGPPCMNPSCFRFHEPDSPGNRAHLCPAANRDEPSYRTTPVTKKRLFSPRLARPKNDASRLSVALDAVVLVLAASRLLKPSAPVNNLMPVRNTH